MGPWVMHAARYNNVYVPEKSPQPGLSQWACGPYRNISVGSMVSLHGSINCMLATASLVIIGYLSVGFVSALLGAYGGCFGQARGLFGYQGWFLGTHWGPQKGLPGPQGYVLGSQNMVFYTLLGVPRRAFLGPKVTSLGPETWIFPAT